MSFITERKERSRASNPQDEALATSILLSLPEADREVIHRFYVERQTAEAIERDLGLKVGYVRALKTAMKARFLEERRSTTPARSCAVA